MAQYRVTKLSFIDNRLVEPGAIVDYDGEAGSNLEPVDPPAPKPGRKAKAEAPAPAPEPEAPTPEAEKLA